MRWACVLIISLLSLMAQAQPAKKSDAHVLKFYDGAKQARHHNRYPTTVIGDSTKKDFDPSFKIDCWSGEAFLKVNLSTTAHNLNNAVKKVKVHNGKAHVELSTVGASHKMYALNEMGFEWEIVLPSKPASNVFTYSIETENLVFWKQSMLEFDPEDGDLRPDSIRGSYAVYHASRKGNVRRINGTDTTYENYLTGKAGHMFRPKIVRNDGKFVYGEIDITSAFLVLTVPQKFLDDAETEHQYPVIIDPYFGYNTVGVDGGHASNTYMRFNRYTVSEGTGTVDSGYAYFTIAADYVYGKVGLYTDNGTACGVSYDACDPQTFMDSTTEFLAYPATTWVVGVFAAGATITDGSHYWVAFFQNDYTTSALAYDTDDGATLPYDNMHYTTGSGWTWPTFPTTATTDGSTSHRIYSMYIAYTVSAAGGITGAQIF